MSDVFSEEWTVWHLCPGGWERGTEQSDERFTERLAPPDRVVSYRYTELISTINSELVATLHEEWCCPDELLVEKLVARHGAAPEHL